MHTVRSVDTGRVSECDRNTHMHVLKPCQTQTELQVDTTAEQLQVAHKSVCAYVWGV